MNYFEVAPFKIVRPGSDSFTYSSQNDVEIGQVVMIPVGSRIMPGLVVARSHKPVYATKDIESVIEASPLPSQLVTLAKWLAEYYVTPLANVLQTMLPSGLAKNRRDTNTSVLVQHRDRATIVFNSEQQSAIDTIVDSASGTFLLQGVTGSGKTHVYIELAKRTIQSGKSVIILVPEIALTSQIIADFAHEFDDILVVHSTITESKLHASWKDALHSTTPRIVIGARSALFTPLKSVGLIVVDECHEPSFVQDQNPKYNALRAATMLGRYHNARVVFGSATPLVADRYYGEQSNRPIIRLSKLAKKNAIAATVSVVDMTRKQQNTHHRFLSRTLTDAIDSSLGQGKQVLLFHNRRGSASTTLCENCGWTAECPRCFIPLTLHSDHYHLRCHVCNHQTVVPTDCPVCHHAEIIHKGFGTKLIESEIQKMYPKAKVARFDADNSNSETVNARYDELYNGSIDIIIGTQVVAKGLDLPHLRTVGIIQADSGLALPDFSSAERTFQLLAQVVGRVGRNQHETQVIVQTYQPSHPSVVYGLNQDYESFYQDTLARRRHGHFPPYTYLLQLTCSYSTESQAIRETQRLARILKENIHSDVTIFGPTPAFYERQRDSFRWQLTLKSPKRQYLVDALSNLPKTHWHYTIDPTSLL